MTTVVEKTKRLIGYLGEIEYPINLHEVIRYIDKDISIFDAKFKDSEISGVTEREGDQYNIYVNVNHSENRKRFTVAHEIGHIYLGHMEGKEKKIDYCTKFRGLPVYSDEEQIEEKQANKFAGNLLMPEDEVERKIKDGWNMADLSDYFGVSMDALRVRLFTLGYM